MKNILLFLFLSVVSNWYYLDPQTKFLATDLCYDCSPAVPIPDKISVSDSEIDLWLFNGRKGRWAVLLTLGLGQMSGNYFIGPYTRVYFIEPVIITEILTGTKSVCLSVRTKISIGAPLPPIAAGYPVTLQFATFETNGKITELSYIVQTIIQ